MIGLGNGILFELDGRRYRFDPRRTTQSDVNMISHAHTDHIPSSFRNPVVVCSAITREFVKDRRGKSVCTVDDESVKALDAGHIPGSNMFLARGSVDILYTGDFCTRKKAHTKAAKPVKCDVLIMEATYGKPRYVFPDHDEVMAAAADWLDDLLASGSSAVLCAYPLGKSQELAFALGDLPLRFHPTIAAYNRILRRYGHDLPDAELSGEKSNDPVVYVTSGLGKDKERVSAMRRRGAKVAGFSGWALDRGYMYGSSSLDEAFPISDHCGYDELMEFVRRCSPHVVYTTHGCAKPLALAIRRDLGIDARPLMAKQRMIDQFC